MGGAPTHQLIFLVLYFCSYQRLAMNNNLTSERAILGQYNTTSYITIQDPYLKKNQPLSSRKKGFLSSDAHRRDEFSNVCRTEQHRWALGREAAMTKMHERNKKPGTADADSKRGSKSKSLESKPLAE